MNQHLLTVFKKLRHIFNNFYKKNVFTLAAAVSYYAFLAIFPFFILLIYISTMLFQESVSLLKLEQYLKLFPPAISQVVIGNVDSIVSSGRVFSAISAIAVFYFAFRVFSVMEQALSIIFETHEARSTWKATLKSFVFFLVTAFVLLILFFSGSTFFVISKKLETLPFVNEYTVILLAQIFLETIFFALSYKYMSHVHLSFRKALIGGFVATILWEILKHIFGFYIVSIKLYSLVYGSIGSLILLILWIYYSILIYLFGAEVAKDM
ncbi:MAG: YihY/virulence factor BrkB family protein [Acidobacteria bacterium]|nr:YihY/virulence factor BrkB family protein [Acidobacteriota bacterium]